jgi:hypothetical protein
MKSLSTITSALFVSALLMDGDTYAQQTMRVRTSWQDFASDAQRLESFKRGVQVMQQRSADNPSDPRGWRFQANVHETTDSPATGDEHLLWGTCEHASSFFLPWHRGYLFFFEEILREASGDPNLVLPFWEWDGTLPQLRQLPAAFRDQTSVLYVAERSVMNEGAEMQAQFINPASALNALSFWRVGASQGFGSNTFSSQLSGSKGLLESPSHDAVHVLVGGDSGWMSSPQTAAQDPIFWIHHCNIDRLWAKWIASGQGRSNPTSTGWLNRSHTFINGQGQRVTMTTAQLTQLEGAAYRYAGIGGAESAPAAPIQMPAGVAEEQVVASFGGISVSGKANNLELKNLRSLAPGLFRAGAEAAPESPVQPMQLKLSGVRMPRQTATLFQVVLMPSSDAPAEKRIVVGTMSFFPSGKKNVPGAEGADQGETHVFPLDAATAKALVAAGMGAEGARPQLAIIPVSGLQRADGAAAPVATESGNLTVGDVSLEAVVPANGLPLAGARLSRALAQVESSDLMKERLAAVTGDQRRVLASARSLPPEDDEPTTGAESAVHAAAAPVSQLVETIHYVYGSGETIKTIVDENTGRVQALEAKVAYPTPLTADELKGAIKIARTEPKVEALFGGGEDKVRVTHLSPVYPNPSHPFHRQRIVILQMQSAGGLKVSATVNLTARAIVP